MKKPIILHYHLFKNAGTTIDLILEKNFGENAIRIDVKKPKGIVSNNAVLQYIEKNPKVNSVSSHQLRFPVPEDSNFIFLPMIFIRHPIDRIFSIYSYNKKRNVQKKLAEFAKKMNVSEYITWILNSEESRDMKNFQVLFITKPNNEVRESEKDLELAKKDSVNCLFLVWLID